jgi:hypothetical protein
LAANQRAPRRSCLWLAQISGWRMNMIINRPKLHKKIVHMTQDRHSDPTAQKFWIVPGTSPAYEVDLAEFFAGGRREERGIQGRWRWTADFGGRPGLGQELGVYLRARQPASASALRIVHGFRAFYRFLHEIDPAYTVESSIDVTDAHGDRFLRWVSEKWPKTCSYIYRRVKSTLAALRSFRQYSTAPTCTSAVFAFVAASVAGH